MSRSLLSWVPRECFRRAKASRQTKRIGRPTRRNSRNQYSRFFQCVKWDQVERHWKSLQECTGLLTTQLRHLFLSAIVGREFISRALSVLNLYVRISSAMKQYSPFSSQPCFLQPFSLHASFVYMNFYFSY